MTTVKDDPQNIQHQGANHNFLVHNKDLISIAVLFCFCIFAFLVAVTAILSSHAVQSVDEEEVDHVYFYLLSDMIHPTGALIIYPVVVISLDFKSMSRHAKDMM